PCPQGRTALLTSQAGMLLGTAISGKYDECALKADRAPIGLSSVTSGRQGFTNICYPSITALPCGPQLDHQVVGRRWPDRPASGSATSNLFQNHALANSPCLLRKCQEIVSLSPEFPPIWSNSLCRRSAIRYAVSETIRQFVLNPLRRPPGIRGQLRGFADYPQCFPSASPLHQQYFECNRAAIQFVVISCTWKSMKQEKDGRISRPPRSIRLCWRSPNRSLRTVTCRRFFMISK